MLVNFRFENFLSYNELAHFSMATGSTRRHLNHVMDYSDISLLKFTALYGANASGKSNLVEAIKFSRKLVLNGVPNTITLDKYSKIDINNKERNSKFEFEIIIDNIVYAYGFAVNLFEKKIDSEWLYSLADNKETEIFTREQNESKESVFLINYDKLNLNENDKLRLEVYRGDSEDLFNSLFITELNKNKQVLQSGNGKSILNLIFEWFKNKLEVISPNEPTSESNITYLKKDNRLKLSNFLDAFGTGVKEVISKEISEKDLYKEMPAILVKRILEKTNEDESGHILLRTPDNIHEIEKLNNDIKIRTVTFKHATDDVFYTLGEESDGTIRLVEIYDILVSSNEKVFVVDEIDRSLHPNLTYNFIKEYLKKEVPGQLIVTTHEDRLLDLDMLRRDEIWFVEKQDKGSSKLYSLEKYKERFDRDILKAYLDGRYGSIPEFKLFNP